MSIHKIGSDLVRPFAPKGPIGTVASSQDEVEQAHSIERSDRVDISPQGRDLAARLLKQDPLPARPLEELRTRLREGFYNDSSVAEAVATRLLSSGELEFLV